MEGKSSSVGTGFTIGFTLVLALMAVFVFFSWQTIGRLIESSGSIIKSNSLLAEFSGKNVDLLTWNASLNSLLVGKEQQTVSVETDDHQCGFGRWLYGKGRKDAESQFPSLIPLLKNIEKPHADMHAAAEKILFVQQKDIPQTDVFLRDVINQQQNWTNRLKDAFQHDSRDTLDELPTNPARCDLGKWMYAEKTRAMILADPELEKLMRELEPLHNRLHGSVSDIRKFIVSGDRVGALAYYKRSAEPIFRKTARQLEKIIRQQTAENTGGSSPQQMYVNEVLPALDNILAILANAEKNIRRQMLAESGFRAETFRSRQILGVAGIVIILFGLLAVLLTARRLTSAPVDAGESLTRPSGKSSLENQVRSRAEEEKRPGIAKEQKPDAGLTLIQGKVEELFGSVREANSSSRELDAVLDKISASTEEQSSRTTDLSERIRNLRGSVKGFDDAAAENDETIRQLGLSLDNLEDALTAMLDAYDRAAELSAPSAQSRDRVALSDLSGQLAELIETIEEISEQTNLLSLNASIEAARAGSQGKGFALIADEVGNLAQRSTDAVKKISDFIHTAGQGTAEQSAPLHVEDNNVDPDQHVPETSGSGRLEPSPLPISEIRNLTDRLLKSAADTTELLRDLNTGLAGVEEDLQSVAGKFSTQNKLTGEAGESCRFITDNLLSAAEKIGEISTELRRLAGDTEADGPGPAENKMLQQIRSNNIALQGPAKKTEKDIEDDAEPADLNKTEDTESSEPLQQTKPGAEPEHKIILSESRKIGQKSERDDLMKKRLKKAIAKYSSKR